jgi:hypothetical protein
MGASLKSYKNYIKEVLTEIFDSKPLKTSFNFTNNGDNVSTEDFDDEQENQIRVLFHKMKHGYYELDFMVNYSSFSNINLEYSTKEYSILLNTIAQAVNQFLNEYEPFGLKMSGTENESKIFKNTIFTGQKNRLYNYFVSKLDDREDYMVERTSNGEINITKK